MPVVMTMTIVTPKMLVMTIDALYGYTDIHLQSIRV